MKCIAILVLLLVSVAAVSAQESFEVTLVESDSRISIEEFATFTLSIENKLNEFDSYRIYNPNFPTWDVRTDPIANPITLDVGPNETGTVSIIVDPLKIREIGTYGVPVNVRSKVVDELQSVPLKVSILSTEGLIGGYVPTVITSVRVPEEVDAREPVTLTIVLDNQNIIDYEELKVSVSSNLINVQEIMALGPKERKEFTITTTLDPLTPPQKDTLTITLFYQDQAIITPMLKSLEVTEHVTEEQISVERRFLHTTTMYKVFSNNPNYSGTFKAETSLLRSIFSSQSPKASYLDEDGKKYFVWNINLHDNETILTVRTNYMPLFLVIIALLIVMFGYFQFRSPLLMRKEASSLVKNQGGVTELMVIMHVKNRGKSKIDNIEVTEKIPSIVAMEKEVAIGSIRPAKVLKHERTGDTVVKWLIEGLDPGEERVVSYKVRSKLSILGGFSFPEATASFKVGKRTVTGVSNRLSVNE